MYVSKIENRITFKIKTGYFLELLMPDSIKLLGNTKSNINKDKISEITQVVLVDCNIVNNDYHHDSRVYTFHCTKKLKVSIKDFFSKCDQTHRKLRTWSYLLKKSLMENFIFCPVFVPNKSFHQLLQPWTKYLGKNPIFM